MKIKVLGCSSKSQTNTVDRFTPWSTRKEVIFRIVAVINSERRRKNERYDAFSFTLFISHNVSNFVTNCAFSNDTRNLPATTKNSSALPATEEEAPAAVTWATPATRQLLKGGCMWIDKRLATPSAFPQTEKIRTQVFLFNK
ncbi:uncharacterized protein LOC129989016 [Argiope bruennichi]|uniref:uncharacterized protein LOC129989016 n=1 Tax=Argiope bruennichi TaxID=94029 RepID=UPI002494B9BC|nr:uncharacterized protein LOC129989016 [Argiope bruennichi]